MNLNVCKFRVQNPHIPNCNATKGVIAFNETNGFWLVHSVPKYPPALEENDSYDYPHTGQMYGQSFLCISLHTKSSAEQIGTQMLYNHPYIYSINVPKWVSSNNSFDLFIQQD